MFIRVAARCTEENTRKKLLSGHPNVYIELPFEFLIVKKKFVPLNHLFE